MFDHKLRSLHLEIKNRPHNFERLTSKYFSPNHRISALELIDRFLSSRNPNWQSAVINNLLRATRDPEYTQTSYLVLTALFWRNLTYLASSCEGRNLHPDDLLSQSNLILLELMAKAARKKTLEKIYANLSRSLRRDFYIWVEANDEGFADIPENQPNLEIQQEDNEDAISRILKERILKKVELELWLEVERDDRSLKEIARERGDNYAAFQKRLRRITQKIESSRE